MNNISIPALYQQDGDIGCLARLDGLVASNAFLDKFATELDSAGLARPEHFHRTAFARQYCWSEPIFTRLQYPRTCEPSHKLTSLEQWELLHEFRLKTDEAHAVLKAHLAQDGCTALTGWLEAHPTPSSMREVGLLVLRDVHHDKAPGSTQDAFAAMIVQRCVYQVSFSPGHANWDFFEWGMHIFSFEDQQLLRQVFESLFPGDSMSLLQTLHTPALGSSEHLEYVSDFNDLVTEPGPADFTQGYMCSTSPYQPLPLPEIGSYIGIPHSIPSYVESPAAGPAFGNTMLYGTDFANSMAPFHPPTPMVAPFMPPGSTPYTDNITLQQGLHAHSNPDTNSPTTHADLNHNQSDSLCTKLQKTRSWDALLAYLAMFGAEDTLLDRFSALRTPCPFGNCREMSTSASRLLSDRFKDAIQRHLLHPISPKEVVVAEDAVAKGIESAARIMLSVGVLDCRTHAEEYLLSISQSLIRDSDYRENYASRILEHSSSLANSPEFWLYLHVEDVQVVSQYYSQSTTARIAQSRSGPQGAYDPTQCVSVSPQEDLGDANWALGMQQDPLNRASPSTESDLSSGDSDEFSLPPIPANATHDAEPNHILVCPECHRVYRGKSAVTSLSRHRRTAHRNKMYSCPYCGEVNRRTDNLASHIRIQHQGQRVPKGKEWNEYYVQPLSR